MAQKDDDLKAIREDPRFVEAVKRFAVNKDIQESMRGTVEAHSTPATGRKLTPHVQR